MTMYAVDDKKKAQLDDAFRYHPPISDQQERYVLIREEAKRLAETICLRTPPSREQSLALTHLETAVMWANAAIARNEGKPLTDTFWPDASMKGGTTL